MELTLSETTWNRSLERRWDLIDAQPVTSHPLYPRVEFVPVDLRVWCQVGSGRRSESFRAHAWPGKSQDRDHTFASWSADGSGYPAVMPEWVQDLARAVRADLNDNRTTIDTCTSDFWGYTLTRRWDVKEALPVADRQGTPFIPADVDIFWSFYPDRPQREHRYSIYAHSTGRSERSTAQWGGHASWQNPDLPAWIRELAEAQYKDLVSYATALEAERPPR